MKDDQINQIVTKLSTIISLILINIPTILTSVIAVTFLRYILKALNKRRQFPILTVKTKPSKPTKPIFCTVCLYDVVPGQRYRRLPQCHHCFHVSCVDTWLQSKSTCPLCRNQIPVHLLPRKEQKEPSFLYLFVYFSVKALKKKIRSKFSFSKIVLFDEDEL